MLRFFIPATFALCVSCGLAPSQAAVQDFVTPGAFSAQDMADVKAGKVLVRRTGRGTDSPAMAFPVKDHEGRTIGANADVAVELKAFVPVAAGVGMAEAEKRMTFLMRDVNNWYKTKINGTGKQLYVSTNRVGPGGEDLSGEPVSDLPISSTGEELWVKTESEQSFATVRFRYHVLLSAANGQLSTTVVNATPVVGNVLGLFDVELVPTGEARNFQTVVPTDGGYFYYAASAMRASHPLARSSLNTDTLEPGMVGTLVRTREALAR